MGGTNDPHQEGALVVAKTRSIHAEVAAGSLLQSVAARTKVDPVDVGGENLIL